MPECEICGYESETEHGVATHKAVHSDGGSKKKEYRCEECGETFEDYPSRREGRGREDFFCSRDCKNTYETKEKHHFDCEVCGKDVVRQPSAVSEMGDYEIRNHFCSKECESVYKSDEWVGEDHPSWMGVGGGHEYGPNWSEVRERAIEDGGSECRSCGMTREEHFSVYNQDLDVHHKTPVRTFDGDYEAANRIENLAVLCRKCHMSLEHDNLSLE